MIKLFDYRDFADELCEDPEKKEIITTYEKNNHINRDSPIEEHPFYKDYLSKFDFNCCLTNSMEVKLTPGEANLLARLIFGSLSSSYSLILDKDWKNNPTDTVAVDIRIGVESKDNNISRQLNELWSFQVMLLFEIYVEEKIQYNNLLDKEDYEHNKEELLEERQTRFKKFEKEINDIMFEANLYRNLHKHK